MKSRSIAFGLTLVTLLSVAINIWQHALIGELKLKPASVKSDEPYIQKAAVFWSQKTGTTPSKAMVDRYGKVIFFAGRVCVSVEVEAGGVGGVPVYCFEERSGRLLARYDDVE
jgi:hypothetical protein